MPAPKKLLTGRILGWAATLTVTTLFVLTGVLLVVDLLIPDPIPFIDEILLGLLTILFGRWHGARRRRHRTVDPIVSQPETNF